MDLLSTKDMERLQTLVPDENDRAYLSDILGEIRDRIGSESIQFSFKYNKSKGALQFSKDGKPVGRIALDNDKTLGDWLPNKNGIEAIKEEFLQEQEAYKDLVSSEEELDAINNDTVSTEELYEEAPEADKADEPKMQSAPRKSLFETAKEFSEIDGKDAKEFKEILRAAKKADKKMARDAAKRAVSDKFALKKEVMKSIEAIDAEIARAAKEAKDAIIKYSSLEADSKERDVYYQDYLKKVEEIKVYTLAKNAKRAELPTFKEELKKATEMPREIKEAVDEGAKVIKDNVEKQVSNGIGFFKNIKNKVTALYDRQKLKASLSKESNRLLFEQAFCEANRTYLAQQYAVNKMARDNLNKIVNKLSRFHERKAATLVAIRNVGRAITGKDQLYINEEAAKSTGVITKFFKRAAAEYQAEMEIYATAYDAANRKMNRLVEEMEQHVSARRAAGMNKNTFIDGLTLRDNASKHMTFEQRLKDAKERSAKHNARRANDINKEKDNKVRDDSGEKVR